MGADDDSSRPRKDGAAELLPREAGRSLDRPGEPPVVARLVIEIRSDGSQTIARGALEDLAEGQSVSLEARGSSPAALAASLLKSLLQMPLLARATLRALLPKRPR